MKKSQIIEHRCEQIRYSEGSDDTYLKIRSFNGNWVLHEFRYACEQCVYDDQAQYEGEILSVCDVAINFCPFCGCILNDKAAPANEKDFQDDTLSRHKCFSLEEYNQNYPRVGFSFDTDAILKIAKEFDYWYLGRYSTATERMVLDDEADRDELIFWQGISIKYCPFCGYKLQK